MPDLPAIQTTIAIALFGSIGCLTRYWLSGWVYSWAGRVFPWGTLAVNIVGAFLIGLTMEFALRSTLIPPTLRIALTIGFLGGLTTFSTFSYETFRLLEEGAFMTAATNVLASVLVCLFFTWAGIFVARHL
jgi:CrcB protein